MLPWQHGAIETARFVPIHWFSLVPLSVMSKFVMVEGNISTSISLAAAEEVWSHLIPFRFKESIYLLTENYSSCHFTVVLMGLLINPGEMSRIGG